MKQLSASFRGLLVVWAILVSLVGITMFNAGIGRDGTQLSILALAILFLVTLVKVELILRYFLRLQQASPGWREAFTALITILTLILWGLSCIRI